jgi:hypothetical protein
MRYRLRTLLIVLAVGPVVLAGGYWAVDALNPKPLPPGYYIYDGADVNYQPPPGMSSFKLSRKLPASP